MSSSPEDVPAAEALFAGPGEMRGRCRALDWAATPLGPAEGWPAALREAVRLSMDSGFPMCVYAGPELICIYNDPFIPALGSGRHPAALGRPARQVWSEVWDRIGPDLARVLAGGPPVEHVDQRLVIERGGRRTETFWTCAFSAIRDEEGCVVGVHVPATETTARVGAQTALREIEARHRALATASADVIYRMSPDWSEMRQLEGGGFLSDTAEPSGSWLEQYIHPDDQERVTAAIQAAVRARTVFELEHRVLRADGTLGWTFSRAVPLLDAHGEIIEWIGAASDVTARREAEAALRESEERQAFLLRLSDALRPLDGAARVKATATRLLGERLGVNRVFYAEAEDGHWLVARGYETGVDPLPDQPFAMSEYGDWIIHGFQAGTRLVVNDMRADGRFRESEREAHLALQIGAEIAVPLVKGGELVAMLVAHSAGPRAWSEREIALLDETAERTWGAVERARAEAALRASEARYRTLFESIDEGFVIAEVVYDDGGRAVDALYLEGNPAASRLTGVPDFSHRSLADAVPGAESYWLEIYDRVARTGVAERLERYASVLGRLYEFHVSRTADGVPGGAQDGPRRLAIVFQDVTARKHAEAALRESEERQAFLLRLSDALRPLDAAAEIQGEATRLLREHLAAAWCYYVEWDEAAARGVVLRDATRDGLPSLAGTHDVSDVPAFLDLLRKGNVLNVGDYAGFDELSPELRARYTALGFRSMLLATLAKQGRLVASLIVGDTAARDWSGDAEALLMEVAERTWAAVERARAEVAVRASEARLAAVLEALPVGVGLTDNDGHLVLANAEMLQRYLPTRQMPSRDPGRRARWRAWHPDGRAVDAADFPGAWALRGERVLPGLEMLYRQDDGREVWTRVSTLPVRDANGAVTGVVAAITDVDALKRSTEALRASEERYRLIVEGARDYAILTTDPEGTITSWSPGAEAVYGWAAGEAEGRPVDMTFVPEDRAAGVPAAERAHAHAAGVAPDVRWHQRSDGRRVFIEGATRALRDDAGRLRGFLKVGQDVTRRRQTDEALRASEEQFRRSIQEAPIPVIMHAEDGEVLQVSRTWTELTGWTFDEVPTFDAWLTRAYGEGADAVREHMHALFAGRRRTMSVEFPVRTRGGEVRHWSFSASAPGTLHDGRRFVVGMALDVTERRRAQEALRESEERFRLFAEASSDMLWMRDAQRLRWEYLSPAFEPIYGYPRSEVTGPGDPSQWAGLIVPEDRERALAALERVRAGERVTFEYRVRRADGEIRWLRNTDFPIRDASGRVWRLGGIGQDVTEEKGREANQALLVDLSAELGRLSSEEEIVRAAGARLAAQLGLTCYHYVDVDEARGEVTVRHFWHALEVPPTVGTFPIGGFVTPQGLQMRRAGVTSVVHDVQRDLRSDGAVAASLKAGAALQKIGAYVAVPYSQDGQWKAYFAAADTLPRRWTAAEVELIQEVASRVFPRIERVRAEAALRELNETLEQRVEERTAELTRATGARREVLRQLVTAEEDERRRVSRELHDSLGQLVTALLLGLKALPRDGQMGRIEDLERLADRIAREMQHMAVQLRPPALDNLGLRMALQAHMEEWSQRYGVECDFHSVGVDRERFAAELETTVYRVVQEGLNNVVKHAGATRVSLVLERRNGVVATILEDDGRGFDVEATLASPDKARRLGLRGMRERVALLGGELEIESAEGAGTTLYVRIPLPAEAEGNGAGAA